MSHTIYIPSKGRARTAKTPNLIRQCGLNFKIVVEPQDYPEYNDFFEKKSIVCLPVNDAGLAFSRNFIKELSIKNRESYHWQVDDDISSFIKRVPSTRSRKISPAEAILEVESEVKKFSNISVAGFNQNSWPPGNKKIIINGLPIRCVLIKNSTPFRWRHVPVDDLDYNLQSLAAGYCTLMFDFIRTCSPRYSVKGTGGLEKTYSNQKAHIKKIISFVNDWPPMTLDIKDGWPSIKKNRILSRFKQVPIKL